MADVKKPIHLDTLKISSISTEGPTKTATGGMAADTLLKYGKIIGYVLIMMSFFISVLLYSIVSAIE